MSFSVNFDLNNGCQLRCRMCRPNGGPNRVTQQVMAFDKFKEFVLPILERSKTYQFGCFAEPTLLPYFEEAVALFPAQRKGLFQTNGVVLNEALSKIVAGSGKFVLVKVSFDGASADTFEQIRVGASQAIVSRNIRNLSSQMGKDRVALVFTLQPDNVHEAEGVVMIAKELGAGMVFVHPENSRRDWCALQREDMNRMLKAATTEGVGLYGVGCLDDYRFIPEGLKLPDWSAGIVLNQAGDLQTIELRPLFNLFKTGVSETLTKLEQTYAD